MTCIIPGRDISLDQRPNETFIIPSILYAKLEIGTSPYLTQFTVVLQFIVMGAGGRGGGGQRVMYPSYYIIIIIIIIIMLCCFFTALTSEVRRMKEPLLWLVLLMVLKMIPAVFILLL